MGVCETHMRIQRLMQASFILSEEQFLNPNVLADVSTLGYWPFNDY
jgi:hypothetical protein